MHALATLSEIIVLLQKEGYTEDFNLPGSHSDGSGSQLQLTPGEFMVDKHYRFEGPSDPADETVVYAISSAKFNLKGLLVNGYGPSSNPATDKILQALRERTY